MVAANTVDFYPKPNHGGDPKTSQLGEVEHLVLGTNFRSFHLGDGTKLSVWNHSDPYKEDQWIKDQSDIPDSSIMQCYQVIRSTSRVVRIRFKDATGGKPKDFSLKLKLAKIGDFTIYSNESDHYAIAGIVPADGSLVTTGVYVRNEHTGVYVCTGAVYFQWDEKKQKVVIVDGDNWPGKQLTHQDDGNNNFTITLISTTP